MTVKTIGCGETAPIVRRKTTGVVMEEGELMIARRLESNAITPAQGVLVGGIPKLPQGMRTNFHGGKPDRPAHTHPSLPQHQFPEFSNVETADR